MAQILFMFTYLYPDFDYEKAPRINVVFTDFSKIKNHNEEN